MAIKIKREERSRSDIEAREAISAKRKEKRETFFPVVHASMTRRRIRGGG